MTDDDKHVYFFDQEKRIYNIDNSASEYEMNTFGKLEKIKEKRGGIDYHYDNLDRYYFDETGQRVYHDENSDELYVNDGFSILVNLRNKEPEVCTERCNWVPMVTEESLYLKLTVGAVLKKCLADLFLHQLANPIMHLANGLEKYRHNMIARQQFHEQHLAIMEQHALLKPLQICDQSCHEPTDSEFSNIFTSIDSNNKF